MEKDNNNVKLVLQYYKENLDLRGMLRCKKLSASFCKEIILNEKDKYAFGAEDTYITKEHILQHQKHLTLKDLDLDDNNN